MQRVIIFAFVQYCWNSIELWLSWPSRMSRRWVPIVRSLVCLLKCSSHFIPSSFVVQPFSETPITQSLGRLSSLYQIERWCLPWKMIKGGIVWPAALTQTTLVTYSLLPCCRDFGFDRWSDAVTTTDELCMPIMKPVSSKLYMSSS